MRILVLTLLVVVLIPAWCFAGTSDVLAQAKEKIANLDPVGGEALLQQIVESAESQASDVEEALFWQLMIYSGNFLSAIVLTQSMSAASQDDNPLKRTIAQQMGLSRWAFFVAGGNYLNNTVGGSSLAKVQIELPEMESQDVQMLLSTLATPDVMKQVLDGYSADPAVAKGMVQSTNQYSMYLAVGDALAGVPKENMSVIRRQLSDGEPFGQLHFLDWLARVALDMDSLISEPNGPDLVSIQNRCDKRIIEMARSELSNPYLKEALARSGGETQQR